MEYTDRIDGFQIRDVTYLGEPPKDAPIRFDIVKWEQTEPRRVINLKTGQYEDSTEYCYSVGRLEWNTKEPCMEFYSIGLRWLYANPPQRVVDAIIEFAEKKSEELYAQS